MPIEIRELHIKAIVQDGDKKNSSSPDVGNQYQINAIVAECVEQVINIIKEKEER